jgi:cell division protein ZapA (FtsZ GTPase activity inhibitor)
MSTEIQNWVSINVHIAGRVYPLTVKSEQEELVRQIATALNERVAQYQMQYTHKDKQDCIVMAVMAWSLEFVNAQTTSTTDYAGQQLLLHEKLELLHTLLNGALQG